MCALSTALPLELASEAFPELVNIEQIGLIRAKYYLNAFEHEGRASNASQPKRTSG
jgi:hypothetical protein